MNFGAPRTGGPLGPGAMSGPGMGPMAPTAGGGGPASGAPAIVAPRDAYDAELAPAHEELSGTEIIAWVGNDPILSGDILPQVNEIIEKNIAQIPPEQLDATRRKLLKDYLRPVIETKLIFADAKRKLPKDNMPKIQAQVDENFEKELVPAMIADSKLKTRGELDQKLRLGGSSLEKQRQAYFERAVASQFIHQQVKQEFEITHQQMLDYYHAHLPDYETPPRARWEQLRVRFDRHASREEAWQLLAGWGNELLKGASMAEMAKQHSDDKSCENGLHDWTRKGSVASADLDAAIFNLPVGTLSRIIEDDHGLSIIRVVERYGVVRTPFTEAQIEIKKKIKDSRAEGEMERYVKKLRDRTPVRTVFDDPPVAPLVARQTGAMQ